MVCVASGYWLPPLQYPLIDKNDFVLGYYFNNDVVKGNIFCFLSSGRKGKYVEYPVKGTHMGCTYLRAAPAAPISPDELISNLWTPRTGFVCVDSITRFIFPFVEDGLYEGPRSLDFIATCEEGGVSHHAIKDQTLICFGLFTHKGGAIEEIHVDRANLHFSTWYLGSELE